MDVEAMAAEILMKEDPIFARFYLAGLPFPVALRYARQFNAMIDGAIAFHNAMEKVSQVIKTLFAPDTGAITKFLEEIREIELDPPKTRLQRMWLADRRRTDRERERVRFKYYELRGLLATQPIYKPPKYQ